MFIAAPDYGPFAPVVGYGGAIMAAAGALFLMWGGKMQKWRPPDEDLPGTAQGIVLLLCGVGMVLEWYLATPAAIQWFLVAVALFAVACVVCFLRYSGMLGTFIYIRKEATGENATRDVRILGGRELLPDAEKKRKKLGVDIQTLLEGAAYRVDLVWSREARQWVKQRVLLLFILTLVLGTVALTGAGFATQVLLSKKAAASVVRPADSPPTDNPGDSPNPKTTDNPKRSAVPPGMVGTWQGGLFRPPNAPPAKPNTRVIYELSASGEIKFRDDCTYELHGDDIYSPQTVDVHNGTVGFNEYLPNHQDLAQVKMWPEDGRNLHVVVNWPTNQNIYLEGTLLHRSGELSQIPRPTKEECRAMQ